MKWNREKNKCLIQIREIYYITYTSKGDGNLCPKNQWRERNSLPEPAAHLSILKTKLCVFRQWLHDQPWGFQHHQDDQLWPHSLGASCMTQDSKFCPYRRESGNPKSPDEDKSSHNFQLHALREGVFKVRCFEKIGKYFATVLCFGKKKSSRQD